MIIKEIEKDTGQPLLKDSSKPTFSPEATTVGYLIGDL